MKQNSKNKNRVSIILIINHHRCQHKIVKNSNHFIMTITTSDTNAKGADSTKARNKRKVILEEEFPDYEIILQRAEASMTQPNDDTPPGCPHLRESLPYILSLELAQSATAPNHWMLQNPVHALHLATQFRGTEEFRALRDMPMLYGEEQERRTVLQMRGFTDVHHPYTHDWNELHQHEKDSEETLAEAAAVVVPEGVPPGEHSTEEVLPEGSMGPPMPRMATSTVINSAEVMETGETVVISAEPMPTEDSSDPIVPVKPESSLKMPQPPATDIVPELPTPQETIHEPVQSEQVESVSAEPQPEVVESTNVEAIDTVKTDPAAELSSSTADIAASSVVEVPEDKAPEAPETPVLTYKSPERLLDENRYWNLHTQESHIEKLRNAFLAKRMGDALSSKKKRKADSKPMALQYMMAWRDHRPYLHKIHDTAAYKAEQDGARRRANLWMEHYRQSRMAYWQRRRKSKAAVFGAIEDDISSFPGRKCHECYTEDGLMQCLQCSVTACGPDRLQHMMNHNLESNHNFGTFSDSPLRQISKCFESYIVSLLLQPSRVITRPKCTVFHAGTLCSTKYLMQKKSALIFPSTCHGCLGKNIQSSVHSMRIASCTFLTKESFGGACMPRIPPSFLIRMYEVLEPVAGDKFCSTEKSSHCRLMFENRHERSFRISRRWDPEDDIELLLLLECSTWAILVIKARCYNVSSPVLLYKSIF